MNLLIDWGNSQLKAMLVEDLSSVISQPCELTSRVTHSVEELIQWLSERLDKTKLEIVLLASVRNDQQTQKLVNQLDRFCKTPFIARTSTNSAGVSCAYLEPSKLGIDRWLAIIAGHNRYKACVLVDIGSAITLDVVSKEGIHLGGHIVPGLKLIKNSLQFTDKVIVEKISADQSGFQLGKSTGECVDFGIQQLILGYLKSVISELSREYLNYKWIFTGGGGAYWLEQLQSTPGSLIENNAVYQPNIVFTGLAIDFLENNENAY